MDSETIWPVFLRQFRRHDNLNVGLDYEYSQSIRVLTSSYGLRIGLLK